MSEIRLAFAGVAVAALIAGCAAGPPKSDGDHSALWGYVRLVPRDGVAPSSSGGYGDRRLSGAALVDYTRPGFAVVYVDDGAAATPETASLRIVTGRVRPRLEPNELGVRSPAAIDVENASDATRLLSVPRSNIVRAIAPGETLRVQIDGSGPYEIFLVDGEGARALVFAAPGPMDVVDAAGRFELSDLGPGPHALHVWHPRFPPTRRDVDLMPGTASRVDVSIGVGRDGGGLTDAR